MRADVPVALDLLPCFWKSLKGEPLSISDLQEADFLTYSFTQQLLEVLTINTSTIYTINYVSNKGTLVLRVLITAKM